MKHTLFKAHISISYRFLLFFLAKKVSSTKDISEVMFCRCKVGSWNQGSWCALRELGPLPFMVPLARSRWCCSSICERLSCQLWRKLLSSSSMSIISMLCLETSCSEGPWPNDSRGVGWVSMFSRTIVADLTLVSDNKQLNKSECMCIFRQEVISWLDVHTRLSNKAKELFGLVNGKFRITWLNQTYSSAS